MTERGVSTFDRTGHRPLLMESLLDTVGQLAPGLFEAGPRAAVREHAFGGGTAAQALWAATQTVEQDREVHAVHCRFLRHGDTTAPTQIEVTPTQDGRRYTARSVVAEQHGRKILTMDAAFHLPESGWQHQVPTADAPDAEDVPALEDRLLTLSDAGQRWLDHLRNSHPFEFRFVDTLHPILSGECTYPPRLRAWLRSRDPLPSDRFAQACAMVYVSDLFLLSTAMMPHVPVASRDNVARASLDHAVWLHRTPDLDDWHLFDMESTWAGHGRALCGSRIFDRDGRIVATVQQEVMLRQPSEPATD